MSLKEYSKKSKKVVAMTMAATMCLSAGVFATNSSTEAESTAVRGDLNSNGKVDLEDTLQALKIAIGIEEVDEAVKAIADVDSDGNVTLNDVMFVLKNALGIAELPEATDKPAQTPGNIFTPAPNTEEPVPVITQTPAPTSIPLDKVEPGTAVTGTAINSVEDGLNGAEYDEEKGIYTFTDANKTAKRGIKFTNPWAGKTSLNQTVEEALPSFLIGSDKTNYGLIQGNDLIALNGKDKIGTLEVKGKDKDEDGNDIDIIEAKLFNVTSEAVTAEAVTSEAAEVVTGTSVTWHVGLMPVVNGIDTKLVYLEDYAALYAKPTWTNGVSISFWAKYDWATNIKSDSAPFLVIKNSNGCDNRGDGGTEKENHTGDFALMVKLDGSVSMEGDESGNCFKADNYIAGTSGEWNYYTVTFANDWITVYVNGQELVYNSLNIDKDDIGYFNNGFLTRYNPVYEVEKSSVTDIRNYLKKGWLSKTGTALEVLDKECCIIGNSRYKNPDAVTIKKNSNGLYYDLLVDLITKETTEIWFGSTSETNCVCLTSAKGPGSAEYKVSSGTQLAAVNCYDSELKADEVAANYEKEYAENAEKFGLTK